MLFALVSLTERSVCTIKIEEKLLWRAYANALSDGIIPYPLCPECFGYPLLSQERVNLRTSNLAGTFTESIRTKAH